MFKLMGKKIIKIYVIKISLSGPMILMTTTETVVELVSVGRFALEL